MKKSDEEIIGGGTSQTHQRTPSGRPRERNADETAELYKPMPCRYCGITVEYPNTVCERQSCQGKYQREIELDDRIRNRLDMGRGDV